MDQQSWPYPEHAGTVSSLRYCVVKELSCFHRTIFQAESVVHHQYYIDIIRIWFGGNVTPEEAKALNGLSSVPVG